MAAESTLQGNSFSMPAQKIRKIELVMNEDYNLEDHIDLFASALKELRGAEGIWRGEWQPVSDDSAVSMKRPVITIKEKSENEPYITTTYICALMYELETE